MLKARVCGKVVGTLNVCSVAKCKYLFSGLYYKHITIIIDAASVVSK